MEKLSPEQIFGKTGIFVLLKIALAAVSLVLSIVVLAIIVAVSSAGEGSFNIVGALIWLVISASITFAVNYFAGYIVKAGHVDIAANAVEVGMVPEEQLKNARQDVGERFVNCNVYFSQRTAVRRAVGQIQKSFNAIGSPQYRGLPVVAQLIAVVQFFIGLSLTNFISDCCLGYTFTETDKGLYKSSAESVMAYHQSWRNLVDNGLKLAGGIIAAVVLVFVLSVCIFAAVFTSMFGGNAFAGLMGAFAFGYFAVSVVKNGIIDSYLMINYMEDFINEARYCDVTQEAFGDLYRESSRFAVLYSKAKQEEDLAQSNANAEPEPTEVK